MKYLQLTLVLLMLCLVRVSAQMDTIRYLESYFETLADQQRWTSLPADNDKKWTFQTGGNDNYNPDTAYEGNVNAFYFWGEGDAYTRQLVSPKVDLSDAKKPQLSFGHAMLNDIWGIHNLKLMFKAGNGAPWEEIASYSSPAVWTLRTFNIKDFGTKYLCNNFQVAFQGTSGGGHGICIDAVVIEEKDIIIRYPKSVKINPVIQNPIPTGAIDIPVMRVDITIVGNTDQTILDSITFKSLSSHDSLFATSGFELVATKDSIYRPVSKGVSLKIGTPVSIANGKITFDNLNYNLTTGYNAIWLVVDIKSTAPHKSMADFKAEANAIKINTTRFPSSEVSPAGFNTIEHAVFYDSFEGTTSWSIQTDFEIAVPKGYVAHITADPDFAYSGTKVLGTDLTADGKYRLNIGSSSAYFATTPVINLKFYDDVKVSFKKWIAFEGNDQGVVEVSVDTAKTWQRIWDSKIDALSPDNNWIGLVIEDAFDAIAARHPWVKIRFGVVYSDNSFAYAGFNIDNFAVTGNYLTNDIGITGINKPVDDCHNPGADNIEVVVRNFADRATASNIPVFFSIYGNESLKVYDTIPGPIPVNGSITFAFTKPANFPGPGNYSGFKVKVEAAGDEDADNDAFVKPIYIQKSISLPHTEDFETGGGYWKPEGSSPTWLCRTPEGSIPLIPGSPNAWILSPFGNYITNDTSYVESSCYDLATQKRSVFEMKLWLDSEQGKDGTLVEYSKDDGSSWNILPANEYGWNWNWYNGAVAALGTAGWSGNNSQDWVTVKQVLPATLSAEPKVKFRLKWASDDDNTYRGMAFDNVKVYTAPPDISMFQIDSFADRCQYINPDRLTVTIKNTGVNPLKQQDTIVVGFNLNQVHMATDTFKLSADLLPGQTIKHTFLKPVDVTQPGNYNLTAYTLIEDDPYFYLGNNDTLSVDFEVLANPFTDLTDTISTREPDTVVIRPFYHADYDYLWDDNSTGSTYDVETDGWYHVTVTAARGNGCISHDSSYIELLFNDAGVDSLLYPFDHCGLSDQEYPKVRLRNYGTDSIPAGQRIAVAFQMDSGVPVTDTLLLTRALYSGHAVDFEFTEGAVDLSDKGIYNFRIYASFSGDTLHSNDTLNKQVEIFGLPIVNIGPDLTVKALSYTLDAGSGYSGYEWDNGVSTRTREVTETGSYWVMVVDNNGCENSDTAYIRLKIRDISSGGFASPVSACSFDPSVQVTMRVLNSGTDTIPSGRHIEVSYRLNEGPRIEEWLDLTAPLFPGEYVLHTFTGNVDMGDTADYDFNATAVMADDIRLSNDTTDWVIYRYPAPVVNFGYDDIEYVEGIEFPIEAGYSPHYAYAWQDGFTEHLYNATKSGTYRVIATDTRTACYDGDTVTVFLIYTDVGVVSSGFPTEGCTGTFENIKVRVSNLGTTNIGKDVPIYVACDVNGERVTIDTLRRSSNFATNAGIDLVMSGKIPVMESGASRVTFYTLYGADMKPWNDTLVTWFEALPAPVIDFGDINGVLNTDLPHELDAGMGHKAYLWQDGSVDQTYMVTIKGTYSVTVTGQNDCQTTHTVRINLATGFGSDENASGIMLYPNPNKGLFRISANQENFTGELILTIVNLKGQTVLTRNIDAEVLLNETVDVQNLSPGVYQVLLLNKEILYKGRMVIQ